MFPRRLVNNINIQYVQRTDRHAHVGSTQAFHYRQWSHTTSINLHWFGIIADFIHKARFIPEARNTDKAKSKHTSTPKYVKQIARMFFIITQIASFTLPTWDPPGSCRPQVGPMLVPWTLLSGKKCVNYAFFTFFTLLTKYKMTNW